MIASQPIATRPIATLPVVVAGGPAIPTLSLPTMISITATTARPQVTLTF